MKATTFSFTCAINHLHHPGKVAKKCWKIGCKNLIIQSQKTEVEHVVPDMSSGNVQYRNRKRENRVVLQILRQSGSGRLYEHNGSAFPAFSSRD